MLLENLSSSVASMNLSYNATLSSIKEHVETLNSKEDLDLIKEKLESVLSLIDAVPEKVSFDSMNIELNELRDITKSIKDVVISNNEKFSIEVSEKFKKLENDFDKIVTEVDFAEFRTNLSDFVQKIIDNSAALNTQLSFGTEKLESILNTLKNVENLSKKIDLLDYSRDFDNVTDKLNEVYELCDNNSKANFENIIQEIAGLKQNVLDAVLTGKDENIENYTSLGEKLSDITLNIEFLRDLTTQKSTEVLDNITKSLENIVNNFEQSLNSTSEINFGDMKAVLLDVVDGISQIKADFITKSDSNLFGMTSGLDNLKISLENILSVLNVFSEDATARSAENCSSIIANINEISLEITNLKVDLIRNVNEQTEKVLSALTESVIKLDEFSDSVSAKIKECLFDLQENVASFVNNLQVVQNECIENFNNISKEQATKLDIVSNDVSELKSQVNDAVDDLKVYIQSLNEVNENAKSQIDNKITEKLLNLETLLLKTTDDYENKNESLQIKLAEFAKNIENTSLQTSDKILTSVGEINTLKEDLGQISEYLKLQKLSADEKQEEILSNIDCGLENLISKINSLHEDFKGGLDLANALCDIDENFSRLSDYVQEYRNENLALSNDIEALLVDKFSALKEEFALLNTDISDAVQSKTEDIARLLEPVRLGIEEFLGFDFDNVIKEIKTQLELSFMNFTVDVNGEFSSATESISRLEQAYKDTFDKISIIEECVSEKIQNNIELLNITLETNTNEIKKLLKENSGDNLNPSLSVQDSSSISGAIELMKEEISFKIGEELDEHGRKLSSSLSNFGEELKEYIGTVCEKISLDVSEKFNVLATDPTLDELKDKIDNFTGVGKSITDILAVLNEKMDILALDTSEDDLGAEIDEIKSLISEQRNYFEENNAVDKCLQEVQVKLENIDLAKSSKDIKESIMNALLSLVDQISFVEETEEIKDFVEEKTDEINQNLIQVQNQLRQMTNGGDDFDYVYTLQDVESDIAKLRLAISNMSGGEFESFSDDIKKIVTSVETLESSLTQEQITGLKLDIERLNEDILSISSRTNKLLLTSDESYKVLSDGLNNFSNIIYKLEDRINYLDNAENNARLERKLDFIHSMAVESANSDKVFHQVMTYLGEWIDSTTENISRIIDRVEKLPQMQQNISALQEMLPNKNSMLEDLKEVVFSELSSLVEKKFEAQEARIDRLEMKLEKILSTLEEKDDMVLNRKVDKLENLLVGLGKNIEKLTSYVDEE